MTFEEIKAMVDKARATTTPGGMAYEELAPLGITETDLYIPRENGRPVHIFRMAPQQLPEKTPLLINFHGGGFVKLRLAWDRLFCAKVIQALGCLVWDVDYSLPPEYRFPCAKEESYDVVKYAWDHADELGIDRDKIVLSGHSAGGNLAITVCMQNSENPQFKVAGLMAEYSALDLKTDPALKPIIEGDMPAARAEAYNSIYCEPEQLGDPYVSPRFASPEQLRGFPDTMILTAGLDRLREENEEFARRLAEEGVCVTCKRYVGCLHSFTIQHRPGWEDSTKRIIKFIRDCFA